MNDDRTPVRSERSTTNAQRADATIAGAGGQLDFEFLSEEKVEPLDPRQRIIYEDKRSEFIRYLRNEGKDPRKAIGYSEDSVPSIGRRIHQVFEWVWDKQDEITTTLTQRHADDFIEALSRDEIRQNDGDRYSGDSKRKFADALEIWFRWESEDWESEITFSGDGPRDNSDPFIRGELDQLWEASLTYGSVPSYNNLSPEERDRWKAHIAQRLGKPKDEVTPDDWGQLNHKWDIPSLIRTTREAGWRCKLVGEIEVDWYDEDTKAIHIPREKAVKNNAKWTQELSDEAARALERWLKQRQNIAKYDGRDEIWLNREGNPYNSKNLNRLLNNLMEEAGISQQGRKLTWHSFRHSIATHLRWEGYDLRIIAEILRQKSKDSVVHYIHVSSEMKRNAVSTL